MYIFSISRCILFRTRSTYKKKKNERKEIVTTDKSVDFEVRTADITRVGRDSEVRINSNLRAFLLTRLRDVFPLITYASKQRRKTTAKEV